LTDDIIKTAVATVAGVSGDEKTVSELRRVLTVLVPLGLSMVADPPDESGTITHTTVEEDEYTPSEKRTIYHQWQPTFTYGDGSTGCFYRRQRDVHWMIVKFLLPNAFSREKPKEEKIEEGEEEDWEGSYYGSDDEAGDDDDDGEGDDDDDDDDDAEGDGEEGGGDDDNDDDDAVEKLDIDGVAEVEGEKEEEEEEAKEARKKKKEEAKKRKKKQKH